jgi:hypothetical protein
LDALNWSLTTQFLTFSIKSSGDVEVFLLVDLVVLRDVLKVVVVDIDVEYVVVVL